MISLFGSWELGGGLAIDGVSRIGGEKGGIQRRREARGVAKQWMDPFVRVPSTIHFSKKAVKETASWDGNYIRYLGTLLLVGASCSNSATTPHVLVPGRLRYWVHIRCGVGKIR